MSHRNQYPDGLFSSLTHHRSILAGFAICSGLVSVTCQGSDEPDEEPSGSEGGQGGATTAEGTGGEMDGGEVNCETSGPDPGGAPNVPWDWVGVVGTGQSLAVGEQGRPAKSTTQPYGNLMLSTGSSQWPLDSDDASFEMVPLVEPIGRPATNYPSSYPTNIAGETPHASMANQITALAQDAGSDYVGVHGEFGENGQCLSFLEKDATQSGVNGRAFEATLIETAAVTRLAAEAGMTYGVGAIIVTHGECDAGNTSYADDLYQLWSDYNGDISEITGQTDPILMIVSQQNAVSNRAASTLAAWQLGVDHPDDVVCSGPKYQYPYADDGIHLVTDGYRLLGEKYGQVYFERVVMGRDWRPLEPESVERDGREVTVNFHVPVPPLEWDMSFEAPLQNIDEWKDGNGFELRSSSGRIPIESVEIVCNSVRITAGEDLPETDVFVGYALTASVPAREEPHAGTSRWGRLMDSDPFVGDVTGEAQPNYAVAFELPVP